MREILSLTVILAALWLAISGVYKPVIVLLGVASVVLVVWLAVRMRVVGDEHNPVFFAWRLPLFWLWTLREIIQANFHVARLTLKPERISPRIVTMPVRLNSSLGKVVYGNTCTLTPGTVTLFLDREKLVAHALDRQSAESLQCGRLARKVSWLEGSSEPSR